MQNKTTVLFLLVSSLFSFCFSFLDIDELLGVNYGIDILDKPVLAGEEIKGAIYLKSKFGQSYQCIYPTKVKDEQSKAEDENDGHDTSIPQLLRPLESRPCLLHTKGWWTYELCLKKAVTQYHTEDGKPSGKIMNLGNYDHEYDWSESSTTESKNSLRSSPQHHSQYYTNGSLCELTGNLRSTEIVFKCKAKQRTAVFSVDEPETCVYVITVHTDVLCSHPLLAPPTGTPSIPITCSPLLTDVDYQDYMQQKQERERKKEEAMNKALEKSALSVGGFEDPGSEDLGAKDGQSQRDSDTAGDGDRTSLMDDAMQLIQDEFHINEEEMEDSELFKLFEKEFADLTNKPGHVTKWSDNKQRLMSAMQSQFSDIIDEAEDEGEGAEVNRDLAFKELTQMLSKLLQKLDTAEKDIKQMDQEIEKKLMLQKILEQEFKDEVDKSGTDGHGTDMSGTDGHGTDIPGTDGHGTDLSGTDFSADSSSDLDGQNVKLSDVRILNDDDDDDDDDDIPQMDIERNIHGSHGDEKHQVSNRDSAVESHDDSESQTAEVSDTAAESQAAVHDESPADSSSPQITTRSRHRKFANNVKFKVTDKTPEITRNPEEEAEEKATSENTNMAEVVKTKLEQSGIDTHGRKIEVKIITQYIDGAGDELSDSSNKVVIAVISANDDEVEQQKHHYHLEKGYNFSWQSKRPKTRGTDDTLPPPQ